MSFLLVALGYLCGTIPTGVLLARRAGVDPREAGSRNVGATNVLRTAGVRLGLLTLLGDALKGALPVALAWRLDPVAAPAVGLAAVLGHVYPATMGFRGGKGVATALGVLLVLSPGASAVLLVGFTVSVVVSRRVSLGSIIAAAAAPIVLWGLGYPVSTIAAGAAIGVLILARHRENLGRLVAGTEPMLVLRKGQATPED